jgi:hypothetical protein
MSRQLPKLLDDVRKVLSLNHDSMHTERSSVEWIAPVRPLPWHAGAPGPLPRRPQDESVPPRPGGVGTRGSRDPEPGDACLGVPRPARPHPCAAEPYQRGGRRPEDQRPHGHDLRRRRCRLLPHERNRQLRARFLLCPFLPCRFSSRGTGISTGSTVRTFTERHGPNGTEQEPPSVGP